MIDWLEPFNFDRLIHAMILQESAANYKAVSRSGAQGLMQLMPATGKELHKNLKEAGVYSPFNIPQNIRLGTHYIRYLLNKYEGDVVLALTAYNQGYGAVNRLRRRYGKTFEDIKPHLGPDGKSYAEKVLSRLDK
jgi:soluble lytic murein transglycosylase-like protein